jgi:hypothetical protein
MMYAITWNNSGTKMIQVGIEPKRLIDEMNQNQISVVISNMRCIQASIYLLRIVEMAKSLEVQKQQWLVKR